ncbi:hypothetical protein B0F90DRAFT_1736955 [Multifurca ochricompacta]|uniref:Uncharacterized protein n=1 Tax=Multifurca ochricompacta TaxID=376703 RepID=A0AAD4M2F2_9AGAM|nr:hypothetical protein B0F90DRAFT_1736955 [Multifurca ochricompacta]
MSNTIPQSTPPQVIPVTRRNIWNAIKDFMYQGFAGKRVQRADSHMDSSRGLLHQYWAIMDPDDQTPILGHYRLARELRSRAENIKLSSWTRIMSARDYQLVAKQTFTIIKEASERAIDDGLVSRMANDTGLARFTTDHPIFDLQRVSSIVSDWSDSTLEAIQVDEYQSAITGESAFVLNVSGRGVPTQQILATSSPVLDDLPTTDTNGGAASETGSIISSVCQTDIIGPISEEYCP